MSDGGTTALLVFLYFPRLMSFGFNGMVRRRQHKDPNQQHSVYGSFITTINSSEDQRSFYASSV
jgi:hypothetical protein